MKRSFKMESKYNKLKGQRNKVNIEISKLLASGHTYSSTKVLRLANKEQNLSTTLRKMYYENPSLGKFWK